MKWFLLLLLFLGGVQGQQEETFQIGATYCVSCQVLPLCIERERVKEFF